MPGAMRSGKFAAANLAAGHSHAAAAALKEPLLASTSAGSSAKRSHRSTEETSWDRFDENSSYSEELLEGVSMSGKDIVKTIGVSILVTGGMAASASAMVAAGSAIVFLMGGVCVANAPTVAVKHLRISKRQAMRSSVNNIRAEIDLLKNEINYLGRCVDDLQVEVDGMAGLEEDLQEIASEQRTNVNELVELVKENEEVLAAMKSYMKQTFASAMVKVVLRSDNDGDGKIDMKELPMLSLRIKIQLQPYGIAIDTAKFEAMIREDNDISTVMKFCREVLFPEDTANDDDSVDSEVTFDFEQFCKGLGDEDEEMKMTHEEKLDMVSIDEKYSKGSVEVARGKRMTLMPKSTERGARKKSILNEAKRRQTVMRQTVMKAKPKNRGTVFATGLVVVRD